MLEAPRHRYTPPSFAPPYDPETGHAGGNGRNRESWERRARALGIDAEAGTDAHHVALILLAGLDLGQNIDRLARRTRAPRPLVSKVARRLVENGVWADGETVARWTGDPTARAAFANDVGVGTGRLLRRIGENGRMEWAEAGRWHKNFERETEDRGTSAVYSDAPDRPATARALFEDVEPDPLVGTATAASTSDPPADAALPARTEPSGADAGAETAAPPQSSDSPDPGSHDTGDPAAHANGTAPAEGVEPVPDADPARAAEADASAPSLEQVFSDAVWLR